MRRWFVAHTKRAHLLKPDGETARCGWRPLYRWSEIDPDGYAHLCGLCRRSGDHFGTGYSLPAEPKTNERSEAGPQERASTEDGR